MLAELSPPATVQESKSYEGISISYESSVPHQIFPRLQPTERFRDREVPVQTVTFAEGKWSTAKLDIVFPHPNGDLDKGIARLTITRYCPCQNEEADRENWFERSTRLLRSKPDESVAEISKESLSGKCRRQEIWEMEIQKDELDILLSDLKHRGFFQPQQRPRGEVLVDVHLDHENISKRWTNEPRLEELMLEVFNSGQLTQFQAGPPASLTRTASSKSSQSS